MNRNHGKRFAEWCGASPPAPARHPGTGGEPLQTWNTCWLQSHGFPGMGNFQVKAMQAFLANRQGSGRMEAEYFLGIPTLHPGFKRLLFTGANPFTAQRAHRPGTAQQRIGEPCGPRFRPMKPAGSAIGFNSAERVFAQGHARERHFTTSGGKSVEDPLGKYAPAHGDGNSHFPSPAKNWGNYSASVFFFCTVTAFCALPCEGRCFSPSNASSRGVVTVFFPGPFFHSPSPGLTTGARGVSFRAPTGDGARHPSSAVSARQRKPVRAPPGAMVAGSFNRQPG